MDGIEKGGLLNLIDTFCGVRKMDIGKIELKGAYSFFEVDKSKAKDIIDGFRGAEFQGRRIRLELTDGKPSRKKSSKSTPRPEKQKKKHRKGNSRKR